MLWRFLSNLLGTRRVKTAATSVPGTPTPPFDPRPPVVREFDAAMDRRIMRHRLRKGPPAVPAFNTLQL